MFKRRTLFIVGAGASAEFKLPVGSDLARNIAQRTDLKIRRFSELESTGDHQIFYELQEKFRHDVNLYLQACWRIRDGVQLSASIDDFLDIHASDLHLNIVGKLAIVRSILDAERHSRLYFERSPDRTTIKVSSFEDTWLIKLIRMLGRGVAKEKIGSLFENVSFIVFNYDRCIEHCLLQSLQQLFSIEAQEAAEVMKSLSIIHPYGQVGDLRSRENPKGLPFGGEQSRSIDYLEIAKGIKTYTEQVGDVEELRPIHDEMNKAERIVFLGFAFHNQNLALIKPPTSMGRKEIFGTAFGMSASDVEVVQHQLLTFFNDRARGTMSRADIQIRADLTCAAMFDQYTKSFPA